MRNQGLFLTIAAAIWMFNVDVNAAFVTLTNTGANNTLTPCQGQPYPNSTYLPPTAQASSPCVIPTNPSPPLVLNQIGPFPSLSGTWQLIRIDNDRNVVANSFSIGNIDQVVYRRTDAGLTNQFIIGHRFQLAQAPIAHWNEPADDNMGLPGTNGCNTEVNRLFTVTDIVRVGFANITTVQAAHRIPTAVSTLSGLYAIGRTDRGWAYQASNSLCTNWTAATNPIQADATIPGTTYCGVGGVAGAPVSNPARNLGFIDFRQSVRWEFSPGLAENSQFQYMYYTSPTNTIPVLTANAVRIEQGGEDVDVLVPSQGGNTTIPLACRYRATTSGYTP